MCGTKFDPRSGKAIGVMKRLEPRGQAPGTPPLCRKCNTPIRPTDLVDPVTYKLLPKDRLQQHGLCAVVVAGL
jgi:hypothetical protein